MALQLQKKFSVNLGAIVSSSINAVQAVRRSDQAKKEAEFQRAVADGLSYEEQLAIREKQLNDEQTSGYPDNDFIKTLQDSISNTKKLQRFNNYRTKYATSLGELSAGKINEEDYLERLKSMLVGVDDPELRLEIQNDVATAEGKVKTYRDTILDNQVRKAKYDGTQKSLKDAITKVKAARSTAALSDNEDEVTAYDETLSALNAQFSTVRVQDSLTDFQVKSSTKGTNPMEKLDFINDEIRKSDANTAIKIGDRTYESAAQFWSLERDSYLSGTSQIFGNFFTELTNDTKNSVAADAAKFGYPTQVVLDKALATFNDLRGRSEVAPFLNKLDITQADVMSGAVDTLAKTINSVGTNNLTFKEADAQLQTIAQKYGINTDAYRLALDENLRNLARGGVIDAGEAVAMAPDVEVALPSVTATPTVPGNPAAPSATPANPTLPTSGANRVVKAGDTLGAIAREAGTTVDALVQLNPELKANPNLIKVGQNIKLPGAQTPEAAPANPTPTPSNKPEVPPTATPSNTQPTQTPPKPTQTPTTPTPTTPAPKPVQTPQAPTPAPVSQTAPSQKYTGGSIVDFLKSKGMASDYESRKKLAADNGITGYTGSGDQNSALLKKLNI